MTVATEAPATAPPRPDPQRLGVILVEPQAVVRAGIALLASAQPDMEVLVEASHAQEALQSLKSLSRKAGMVVVIDLALDGEKDSLWLIRSLREQFPSLPLLACGSYRDDAQVSKALFVGADGFVDTRVPPEEFIDAIRRTARGEVILSGVPRNWLGRIADRLESPAPRRSVLTARELEVLTVAVEGLTARQIGARLGVRERTVTTHLSRIYKKLGARSRIGAVVAATTAGLLSIQSGT